MSDDLVERVARRLAADSCGKASEWPLYTRRATAVTALVLEEAARIVRAKSEYVGTNGLDGWEDRTSDLDECEDAIRALIRTAS